MSNLQRFCSATALVLSATILTYSSPTRAAQCGHASWYAMYTKTASGEPYRNHYHFFFRIRGGRILSVKEYVDTLYAQRMLFDPKESA